MSRKPSPRARPSIWSRPDVVVAVGLGSVLGWFLLRPKTPSEFSLVEGKQYEFTLLAHPYGEESEWWQEARAALAESGASRITKIESSPGDVQIRFSKLSPVTAKLPPHTVLYPSTPSLATATLLRAEIASGYPLPLGTSTTVSGSPKSKRPGIDRAVHYEKLAEACEADAKKPHLASEQELNLELAREYRARAQRLRSGRVSGSPRKPRTNEDIARHWDQIAEQCEADAKNPHHRKVRELNLELAADARAKAAATRSGRGAWDHDA